MKKIKLLVGVGGSIGEHQNPIPGSVIEVEDAVADAWADGERAVLVDHKPAPKKRPAKKAATKTVQTAAGESGPEKR